MYTLLRRNWQLIQVFLPGESHGLKSLADPGVTKSDMTECLYDDDDI